MRTTVCLNAEESSLISDDQLIESARMGDQRGFEQLVQRYQDRLFRSMLSNVGCHHFAEEIVQEAFVQAFRFLDSFRQRSNFYTWLYRIALNSRRNYLRKNRVAVRLDAIGEPPPQMWTRSIDSPSGRAERSEDCSHVREALARLKERHRTILVLREFDGLEYQQIADITNLNIGTVRSRLSRARACLRDELAAYVETKPTQKPRLHAICSRN